RQPGSGERAGEVLCDPNLHREAAGRPRASHSTTARSSRRSEQATLSPAFLCRPERTTYVTRGSAHEPAGAGVQPTLTAIVSSRADACYASVRHSLPITRA